MAPGLINNIDQHIHHLADRLGYAGGCLVGVLQDQKRRHFLVDVDLADRCAARCDGLLIAFLNFELRFDVGGRAPVAIGSDLPALTIRTELSAEQRTALQNDLDH